MVLGYRHPSAAEYEFLIRTTPDLDASAISDLIKGHTQYELRRSMPKALKRNYRIETLQTRSLSQYTATVELMMTTHSGDGVVDQTQKGWHGLYQNNFVFEFFVASRRRWNRTKLVAMVRGACQKKRWSLAKVGCDEERLIVIAGVDLTTSPRDAGMSLMNNLAYAHDNRPVLADHWSVYSTGSHTLQQYRESQPSFGQPTD